MIIHNPILTGSFTVNGTDVASITSSAASITAINSYTASQNILNGTYATTGSNTFKNPQTINSNLTVTGSITAATLVVQTITSSVIYSSGSNVFGNNIANTQVLTGSVTVTGSLAVVTNGTEFQVTSTGVNLGNALTDNHVISGSLTVNPNGLFVSSSGNVGIGTSTPSQSTLGINRIVEIGGASAPGIILRSTSSTAEFCIGTGGDGFLFSAAGAANAATDNIFRFFTGPTNSSFSATERMRITSGGNVGIGTSSPNYTLHIDSNTSTTRFQITNSTTGQGGAVGFQLLQIANDSILTNRSNGYMSFETIGTERMRITSTGSVGIGTSSPLNVLDVRQASAIMGNYQTIQAFSTDSAAINLGGGISLGGYFTGTTSIAQFGSIVGRKENGTSGNYDGYLAFGTNAQATGVVERMRITSAGNVCIGETLPLSNSALTLFPVNGATYAQLSIKANNAAGSNAALYLEAPGVVGGGMYQNRDTSTLRVWQASESQGVSLANSATSWGSYSDERMKDIIEPITNALNKVNTLRTVIGKYKIDDADKRRVFLIAQDVQAVLPEAVYDDKSEDKMLSLQYTDIIPLLTAAIQELNTKFEEYKATHP